MELKKIDPDDLVPLNDFLTTHPLQVDLPYIRADHPENIFKTEIYRPTAKAWVHHDMAGIILRAAEISFAERACTFVIKDALRTVEAQEKMRNTEIVKANPHWLEEPVRLLSPPGKGGHPRGMAVDVVLIDKTGKQVDMGTVFDYLSPDPHKNPAARNYPDFSSQILENRKFLENCMLRAAAEKGHALLPLPQEWWDFRFYPEYSNTFAPISDYDLPPDMRMTHISF